MMKRVYWVLYYIQGPVGEFAGMGSCGFYAHGPDPTVEGVKRFRTEAEAKLFSTGAEDLFKVRKVTLTVDVE